MGGNGYVTGDEEAGKEVRGMRSNQLITILVAVILIIVLIILLQRLL